MVRHKRQTRPRRQVGHNLDIMVKPPMVIETKEVAGTKFLKLEEAEYLDKKGEKRKWQYVNRTKDQKVVTTIVKDNNGRLLFIAQPRVPLGKVVIGFPGGLIDEGETPDKAALRELKEETGYEGKIIYSPKNAMSKSAGLTSESTYIVEIVVNSKEKHTQQLEATEDIQYFWMTPAEFIRYSETLDSNKFDISSGVGHYIAGNAKKTSKND